MTTSLADYCRDRRSTDTALTGGTWQRQGLVMVWVPDVPQPRQVDLSTLIACPTCHARIDQSCRTRSGHTTAEHANRLVRRKCACGSELAGQRRYCDDCRDERNRLHKQAWRQRTRQETPA